MSLFVLVSGCSGPEARNHASETREHLATPYAGPALISEELDLDNTRFTERVVDCPTAEFGNTSYLVSHSDLYGSSGNYLRELAVTRFDRNGTALDRFGIPIAAFAQFRGCAPLTFTGTSWLVTWAHEGQIRCARVLENGVVLDPGGQPVGFSASDVDAVAWDGTNALLLTSSGTVGLLGPDCVAIGTPAALPLSSGGAFRRGTLAFDGTQYWATYTETVAGEPDEFLAQPISTQGIPVGVPISVASATWIRPPTDTPLFGVSGSIAAGSGKASLAYHRQAPNGAATLSSRNLSPAGVLGGERTLSTGAFGQQPDIEATRSAFVIAQGMSDSTTMTRVDEDGSVVTALADVPSEYPKPSLAHDGDNTFLASHGYAPTRTSRAQLFDGDLNPLSGASILKEKADFHACIAVASASHASLVVWRNESGLLLGSRVSLSGAILDAEPFEIHPFVDLPLPCIVASNTSDFLVVWHEGGVATAQRVSGAGKLVGSSFVVSAQANPPFVASDGSGYLFAWVGGYYADGFHTEVRAARVSSTGAVLDDPPLVLRSFFAPAPDDPYYGTVAVAYDGSAYVVASSITNPRAYPPVRIPIEVQRIAPTGGVLESNRTAWFGDLGAMTWGRNQGLVVFLNGPSLIGGRLDAAGRPLDAAGFTITDTAIGVGSNGRNTVAWDGSSYWVGWKDTRRIQYVTDDIFVARVATSGAVLDRTGIEISRGIVGEHQVTPGGRFGDADVALTASGNRVLAAYTRFENAREVFNHVLHGRFLDSDASGGEGGSGDDSGGTGGNGGSSAGDGGQTGEPGGGGEAGDAGAAGTGASGGSKQPATGGRAGTGGSSGQAGISGDPGAGGEPSGTGGGSKAEGPSSHDDGGCACRTGISGPRRRASALALALIGICAAARRRRSPVK